MEQTLQDLRYSIRTLLKSPGFTIVAVLTLAIGIGANTAVFSVINTVLVRSLPYEDPHQLAVIWTNFGPDLPQNWVSGPEFVEMGEFSTTVESIGAVAFTTVSVTSGGEPEEVRAAAASGDFLRVLGVDAAVGRTIVAADDDPEGPKVAMLSNGYWRRRFGGDPNVVGSALVAGGQSYTIVGVLPEGFKLLHPDLQLPDDVALWAPFAPLAGTPYAEMGRGSHFLRVVARMKRGVSLEQLRADMNSVALQMQEKSPDYYDFEGWGISAYSLHGDLVEDVKPALQVLLGAVGFVLLIACANVANLQLTRTAAREREIAVRMALGAGRARLTRQFLTESVVLSLTGGVLGLVGAYGLLQGLVAFAPDTLPRRGDIAIDGGVLLFTFGIACLTGLLFGLAPLYHSLKESLVGSLKEGAPGGGTGIRSGRTRGGLVMAEMALALVLLIGAGLMIKSFANLMATDPGYDPDNLLTMRISLPQTKYDTPEKVGQFYDFLLTGVRSIPGVVRAGAISHLPLSGAYASGTTWVSYSQTVPEDEWAFEAERRWVSPDYFRTMGVQVVQGRAFNEFDDTEGLPVAIVDEEFVRRFWPDENPLGKSLSINRDAQGERIWREIVGVVRHSKHYDLSTVGREQAYYPSTQMPQRTMYLAVRTESDPLALTAAVRREVWAIDPNQPVSDVRAMNERVSVSVSQPRFNLLLLGSFSAIALLLATVGIYGVIAYTVSQRGHEIGVRMALGAAGRDVATLVLGQGLKLAGVGLGIGLLATVWLTRLMANMLYGVNPIDVVTYGGVVLFLGLVAAAACSIPALRASRVHPMRALRQE
jgi:putative ABC transport system permease protein